jgi:hypothetical protein
LVIFLVIQCSSILCICPNHLFPLFLSYNILLADPSGRAV